VVEAEATLGGSLLLSVELSALDTLTPSLERLTATEPDDLVSPDAILEHQGPPNFDMDPTLLTPTQNRANSAD
jgi:hypothetical protein